jgi:hypothetical protein
VARLRALAAECRELARMMSLRTDRELLLANARQYDQAAERLEQGAKAAE